MKGSFVRKLFRFGLPVVAVLGTLVPIEMLASAPTASADATTPVTTSVTCSVSALLQPGEDDVLYDKHHRLLSAAFGWVRKRMPVHGNYGRPRHSWR